MIAQIVAQKFATYHELETVYGLEDAMNLSEIIRVQAYNEQLANGKQNGI